VRRDRPGSIVRSFAGIVSACLATIAAVFLLAFYTHARIVTPIEKARVEALKLQAKTDLEVQKILQPEFNRQHEELVVRRNVYRYDGLALLASIGVFLVWFKWLRPSDDDWVGVPARLVQLLRIERPPSARAEPPQAGPGTSQVELREGPAPTPTPTPKRAAPPPVDLAPVDEILRAEGRGAAAVIPVLQAVQSRYRYLPDAVLARVCELSEITPAQIAGVASFYGQFRHHPTGEHIIRVCEGTACHVSGAVEIRTELRRRLGLQEGEDTDHDGQFTIERVACVGSCSLAPVVTIDERIYGQLSALSAARLLHEFIEADVPGPINGNGHGGAAKRARPTVNVVRGGAASAPVEIRIGLGSCGIASGALAVRDAIEAEIDALGGGATIKAVGCAGVCHREPLVEVIGPDGRSLYGNVAAGDARRLVRRHVVPRGVVRKLREQINDVRSRVSDDLAWAPIEAREVAATPYTGRQVRIVLENCGEIDPLSLDDYLARDGMRALDACVTRLTPEDVIEEVRRAGLRGRGGAGFPTATKWDITRRSHASTKYVICNGDEGDPGAFMDRAVLEADPFRVIEGLVIAAFAVGASEGFVYVRREYPIAVRHIRAAIEKAQAGGFLGQHILGTSFSLTLHVREGAGAFVCGEETALIQSIEGQRGMPRPRPPYPAQSGLWGKPTLINNVETLACLPWIFRHGPAAFAALGTETSKGTKVFSLVGKVNRGGLIEVPMGITIRDIVEEIGGGIKGGRAFKAVLAGGPSGGCIPARLADTRIDFEELSSTGAIMGSGGLVVLDDRDCAVEIARYFLHFTQDESCGKCTFCRVGTKRMLEILERICAGKGQEDDLHTLEELSAGVKAGSLCGLGQTAPNPVMTTLRYFREEYEAHIRDRRCPAAVCKALIHYRVLDNCTGCTLCAQACPAGAIANRPYLRHEVADSLCTRCGMCVTACPEKAIEVR
jgi:NADH-quinone oxidoreductase subunit F